MTINQFNIKIFDDKNQLLIASDMYTPEQLYANANPDLANRLIGEAATEAFKKFKKSYEKNHLLDYKSYLNLVLKESPKLDIDQKKTVSTKLKDLAQAHINNVEAKRFKITNLFFRCLNALTGQGFYTLGERGLAIATPLATGLGFSDYEKKFKLLLSSNVSDMAELNSEDLQAVLEYINNLNEQNFEKFLNTHFFNPANLDCSTAKEVKLSIFKWLDQDKKVLFSQQLFQRKDWPEQLFDLFKVSSQTQNNEVIDLLSFMYQLLDENTLKSLEPTKVFTSFRSFNRYNGAYNKYINPFIKNFCAGLIKGELDKEKPNYSRILQITGAVKKILDDYSGQKLSLHLTDAQNEKFKASTAVDHITVKIIDPEDQSDVDRDYKREAAKTRGRMDSADF